MRRYTGVGYNELVRIYVVRLMEFFKCNLFRLVAFFAVAALASTSSLAGVARTSGRTAVASTSARIGVMQIFDSYISSSQKMADGPRYDFVWGSYTPPAPWYAQNSSLIASQYSIFMSAAAGQDFIIHPDWVLYNCLADGTPTHTPAYMQAGAYGRATPVDIHNPDVISDSVHRFAASAIHNGYNALAIDQVLYSNIMGGNAGVGSYGCGVWQGNTFVRRYASKADRQWSLDVVNWVKTAKSIITTDPAIAPYRLKLAINHPGGNPSEPRDQQLVANVDMGLNEIGFTNYGGYIRLPYLFSQTLNFSRYEQAHGVTAMLIDKFSQTYPLTATQREWAVGTYLMANDGNALLYTTYGGSGGGGYNTEHYLSEYGTHLGLPCGVVTGGPQMYQRRFDNGLVVVNADTSSHSATLPAMHPYTDIEGRPVTNPLTLQPTDAFVLTTSAGTGCF